MRFQDVLYDLVVESYSVTGRVGKQTAMCQITFVKRWRLCCQFGYLCASSQRASLMLGKLVVDYLVVRPPGAERPALPRYIANSLQQSC